MRLPAASLVCLSLALAGPAVAQSVMAPGAMPPPPSASEPPPRKEGERKRAPRKNRSGESATTRSSATTDSGYRERIDTRPGGQLQLEDDPRAMQPILQNGRPGMGMRF